MPWTQFKPSACESLVLCQLLLSRQSWESRIRSLELLIQLHFFSTEIYFSARPNKKHLDVKIFFPFHSASFPSVPAMAARVYQAVCCDCIMGGSHLTSPFSRTVWCAPRVIDRTVVKRITMPWCRRKLIILTLWLTCNFSPCTLPGWNLQQVKGTNMSNVYPVEVELYSDLHYLHAVLIFKLTYL